MKNIHFFQILTEVFAFIWTEDTHRQADQCPQVNRLPGMVAYVGQIMNLGMAVMAWCNTVVCTGLENLLGFEFAIFSSRFRETGLQKSAATAAAVVVRSVRAHIDKVFFTDNSLSNETQIFCHRVTKGFAHQLAGILYRKLYFSVLVPVGIDLQFAFFDPLGVVLNDAFDLKFVVELELLRSEPDRE
jgi:hypothetical protein